MAIRQGLIQGLVQGLKSGINYWESSGPTETIYDQALSDVSDFINGVLGTATSFNPLSVWSCNDLSVTGTSISDGNVYTLDSQGGATDTASPHGRAVVCDGSSKFWKMASSEIDYTFGTDPFAIAARIKFTGSAPGSTCSFISKGQGAANDYGFSTDNTGHVMMRTKFTGGGPIIADNGVSLFDGEWHWILGGRSIDNAKLWIVAPTLVEVASDITKSLNNTANGFGIWSSFTSNAPVACEVDHLIVWHDAAENVYTHAQDIYDDVLVA